MMLNAMKDNKLARDAIRAAYRARVKNAPNPNPAYTNTMFKRLRRYAEILEGDWHVDHIQPLSKGGAHSPENFQLIPAIDNLRKSNRV
jgi:5-methylcytosine-specific restriction endonuclease McrA